VHSWYVDSPPISRRFLTTEGIRKAPLKFQSKASISDHFSRLVWSHYFYLWLKNNRHSEIFRLILILTRPQSQQFINSRQWLPSQSEPLRCSAIWETLRATFRHVMNLAHLILFRRIHNVKNFPFYVQATFSLTSRRHDRWANGSEMKSILNPRRSSIASNLRSDHVPCPCKYSSAWSRIPRSLFQNAPRTCSRFRFPQSTQVFVWHQWQNILIGRVTFRAMDGFSEVQLSWDEPWISHFLSETIGITQRVPILLIRSGRDEFVFRKGCWLFSTECLDILIEIWVFKTRRE
jgi:hypothetical protein